MRENTLKELLDKSNLTVTELAHQLGVNRRVVYTWCMPSPEIKLSNYIKLAKVLGVSLKTLATSIGHDLDGIPDDCHRSDDN